MARTTPLITNIQRFCLHDGPGIRTTAFFKGCPLRCAWCHNPETQTFDAELMYFPERCTGCGRCMAVCPSSASGCVACGQCAAACPTQARERVGYAMDAAALARHLFRDQAFFDQSGGGVTLSGGEVMAQDAAYLQELLERLRRRGVSIAVDTCGHAPWARFEQVLPFVRLFLYDLKILDTRLHRQYTGVDNALILDNLSRLAEAGACVHLRVLVIPGVNLEEMDAMMAHVKRHARVERVHLLPYHRLGSDKHARMGNNEAPPAFDEPETSTLQRLAERWQAAGFEHTEIGG